MRYKIICSNPGGSFTIREDELEKAKNGKQSGQPTIFLEGIVLNWNLYAGIVPDKDRMEELREAKRYGNTLPEPNSFAKLLQRRSPNKTNE